jgi:hypothetical protein
VNQELEVRPQNTPIVMTGIKDLRISAIERLTRNIFHTKNRQQGISLTDPKSVVIDETIAGIHF